MDSATTRRMTGIAIWERPLSRNSECAVPGVVRYERGAFETRPRGLCGEGGVVFEGGVVAGVWGAATWGRTYGVRVGVCVRGGFVWVTRLGLTGFA